LGRPSPHFATWPTRDSSRSGSRARPRRGLADRVRRFAAPVAALVALSCASEPPPRATTVLAKVPDRIVILPLNVTAPLPAELKSESPAVRSALELYLGAHGATLKTIAYPSARALWLASIRDARADPAHKDAGFEDAARVFVAKLKESADFDALVVPTLYVQRAILSGTTASWDGSEQSVEYEGRREDAELPSDMPIEGAAPAASLNVVVFDFAGAKLHEGRAGLALLVRVKLTHSSAPNEPPNFSFVARRDPFDRAQLMHGTAKALAPFIAPLSARELDELGARIKSEPPAPASTHPTPP
jgi:hypothetical protein